MLELRDVHTYYGESHILQGVNLSLSQGECVALLGRNGVGKTTTIRSIIGFNAPRRGEITFKGTKVSGLPPHRISRSGIGVVPQGRGIFPNLTVKENLTVAARKGSGQGWDLNKVYQHFPRLKEREKNYGNQLSGGEQQMLSMARAIMLNPEMILLDEPSEGLAPLIVKEIGEIVLEMKKAGLSILLVEQNLSLALSAADRVYIMSKGQVVHESSPAVLKADKEIKHQYLGV